MRTARPEHPCRLLPGAAIVLVALPLAACVAPPASAPTATPPVPSASAAQLRLAPELSAEANLAYFDSIARAVAATDPPDGPA